MTRYTIFILSIFVSLASLAATRGLKIGVITDTHYLSPSLMDGGAAVDNYMRASGRTIKYMPEILDVVLNDYVHSKIDVLLVCGDITKDGELKSHIDFAQKLKTLTEKGLKVFVIPGNHDINIPQSVQLQGNKAIRTQNVSPEKFADIYADMGYKDALQQDEETLSYVAELTPRVWLLAIDAAKYKQNKDKSISSGRIPSTTENWILDVLDEARKKHIQVIGMMHWGLVEHLPYQASLFPDYLVDDWERLASRFADYGLQVVFTGHFHSTDITGFTSERGNTIYDIETGALSSYPFAYRTVELNSKGMDVKTKNIKSLPHVPKLAEQNRYLMRSLVQAFTLQKIKSAYPVSDEIAERLADVFGEILVLHAFGDEKMNQSLKFGIKQLGRGLGTFAAASDFVLDYPPADNNVSIVFRNIK